MKLQAYLAGKSAIDLAFTRVDQIISEGDRDGNGKGDVIATLWLTKPIEVVEGSQTITDAVGGESERLKAYDVESVKIHQDDFEAANINVNEDGSGTIKCNLRLDVSTRGDVWVRSVSFASFRTQKNMERANDRRGGLLKKMNEKKAQSQLKNVDVTDTKTKPEAVASEG